MADAEVVERDADARCRESLDHVERALALVERALGHLDLERTRLQLVTGKKIVDLIDELEASLGPRKGLREVSGGKRE